MLSKGQVHHISRVIQQRGLNSFLLEEEVVDFVSCAVDDRMKEGTSFDEALEEVLLEMNLKQVSKAHKSTTMITKPNSLDMLQNCIKIGLRNFVKYKVNTAINVFGLVLGLSTSIIIGLYLQHEFSFDTMHPGGDRLYRVNSISYMGQSPSHLDAVSPMLRDKAVSEIPEITYASDLDYPIYNKPLKWGGNTFFDYNLGAVQSDFFEMFDPGLVKGDVSSLYARPNGVFLAESLAARIFGTTEPVGQVMEVLSGDEKISLEVRGVFKGLPVNSHFSEHEWAGFDMVTSMESSRLWEKNPQGWGSVQNTMYVKIAPEVTVASINDKLNELVAGQMDTKPWYEHYLQSVNDIHLNRSGLEIDTAGDLDQLYLFSLIAVLILLIACINYINLTTAQASVRLKEVGVRKVIGAKRGQFIFQFLTEAALISFVAMLLSIGLVMLVLPGLNSAYSLSLDLSVSQNGASISSFFAIMLLVSLLCGTYPGFYLSRLQANQLLKGGGTVSSGGGLFRKILVVVQYATSITLIIATLIITSQLDFMSKRELGFDKEQVVYVDIGFQLSQQYGETFFNEVKRESGVLHASLTGNTLGEGSMSGNGILVGDMVQKDRQMHQVMPVDFEYKDALGLEMAEGRWFSEEFGTDRTEGYVVNEAFVAHFGLEKPLGQRIARNRSWGTIVGVVKDFHYKSMKYAIEPLVIHMAPRDQFGYWKMAIRLAPDQEGQSLDKLETVWKSVVPDHPFSYTFLDEEIDAYYKSDRDFANMFSAFSILAIVVSCLGLIGLVSFSTKRRSKEIGVRKVLGATVSRILTLISRDLVKLILFGALIAIPVAYFFMQSWLENFEYRTGISWWTFAVALLLTVIISWLSVSYISFRAARANPVDALRSE
ncbi:MAG: ABC transporter permease [Roseivirga sp.]